MKCFRLLFDHITCIEHQFLSGIRDSRKAGSLWERCGRSKEVRTPQLIGQIKNFMDKDHRVSIETINAQFAVSVGTVHTIIRDELKMRKICAKFVPRVLREDQKERCCHDSREMVELINSDPEVLDALVTCDGRDRVLSGSMLALPDPRRSERANPLTNFWWPLFFWQHWHDLHALGFHWNDGHQDSFSPSL